tara:strand:- start:3432 stop:4637 length:1206 start_codon:yes stop_codon:yes gene_type:complete
MIFICGIVILSPAVHLIGYAQDLNKKTQKNIQTYDPNSSIAINYGNWSTLLRATVTRARMSSRIYAQKANAGIGSKINNSNSNPTRMEASRVFYHYINDEELEYIHDLRLGMEALPTAIPLQNLNRDEQLAYWLNLYNITVYELVAKNYPIRSLKKLHGPGRKKSSVFEDKILNINGIDMSLNEIRNKIILEIWPNPLVLYGMYQGTIGGPNLRRSAFTGKRVYEQLEDNAEEFVNSLRGIRFQGKEAHVSEIYKWNKGMFPDFDKDLRRHLTKYLGYDLVVKLKSSRKIKAKIYDWHTADVLNGGQPAANSAASTNPVALVMQQGTIEDSGGIAGVGGSVGLFSGGSHGEKARETASIRAKMPAEAAVFLQQFIERNRQLRGGNVTIEEVDKKDLKQDQK